MIFLLKLASTSFSEGFHWEEKPLNKKKWFLLARKSVSTSRNEKFCWEILFRRRKKKLLLVKISEKWRKNSFHLLENQLFTCGIIFPQQEVFAENFCGKTLLILIETVFLARKKPGFFTVSPMGSFLFKRFFIPANLLSSRNSTAFFRAV